MFFLFFNFYENYDYFSDVFFDSSVSSMYNFIQFFHISKESLLPGVIFVSLICLTFWGFLGIVFMRSNYILIMICIELMLLGFGLLFCFMSLFRGCVEGFLFTIVIQSIAACEAALGLSLLVSLNSKGISVQMDYKEKAYYDFIFNNIFFLKKYNLRYNSFFLISFGDFHFEKDYLIFSFWQVFFIFFIFLVIYSIRSLLCGYYYSKFNFFFSHIFFLFFNCIFFFYNFNMYLNLKALLLSSGGRVIFYNFNFFGLNFSFVFDAYSIYFFLLTSFITLICSILVPYLVKDTDKYIFVHFFLQFSQIILMIGFLTENLLLFWVSFEAIVIPLIYFVNTWGSRARKLTATYYLLLYTVLGGIVFFFAIIYIYNVTGSYSLSILHNIRFSFADQKILWWMFLFTFAIKIPIMPFHLWLPEAHVEASTIGSMILAGLVLKLGGYGFLRYSTLLFPEAHAYFSDIVIFFSLFSALFAGLFALKQFDLKKLIAYASVSHMSLGACALFVFNCYSVVGSLMMLVAHAFTAAALFMAIGFLYLRTGSKHGSYYGSLRYNMPKFTFFLFICFLANVSFPGTINFIAEYLMILGFFDYSLTNFFFLGVLFFILFLNASFMLLFYNRVVGGLGNLYINKRFVDLTLIEIICFFFFIFPIIYWGLYPNGFLSIFNNNVILNVNLFENKYLYW